jgi:catechol 2,3-dioxygenase-like lactoylglutathione lyase family enzyme
MSERKIKALGEIALRVNDLDAMQKFYSEAVGLELIRRFPQAAFFKIAEGYAGHTAILALFDRAEREGYAGLDVARSTIDHFAFTIDLENYEPEKARLEGLGLTVTTTTHDWVQWRSLYFHDPEGHSVEFVCYDPSIPKSE